MSSDQWTCVLSAIAVISIFFVFAADGLYISLSLDDLMNLYFGWREPTTRLVVSNLAPFTTVYRPAGSAVYVAIHHFVGLDPIYYRLTTYGILLLGCVVMNRLTTRIDGRALAGALCVVPLAFHSRLMQLYSDNGFIYDLLCALFFALTIWFYHHARRGDRVLRWSDLVALYFLWACAINAKEMGLTLPAMLIGYEFVFFGFTSWRRLIWPVVLFGLSVVAWRAKVAPGSPMHGVASYEVLIDATHVLYQVREHIASVLMTNVNTITPVVATALMVMFSVAALATRRKAAQFGLLWLAVTPWPIFLSMARPLAAMYIPWMGFCLTLGVVMTEVVERIRWPRTTHPAVVVGMALTIGFLQRLDLDTRASVSTMGKLHEPVRSAIRGYGQVEGLCRSSRMLIAESRFDAKYHPLFIVQMLCDNPGMTILIPESSISKEDARETIDNFDMIIVDDGDRVRVGNASDAPD